MRTMRRAAGAAAVVLLAVTGCDIVTDRAGPQLLIGVDVDLTGSGARLGVVWEQALRLQLDRMAGQTSAGHPLRLRVLDNQGEPATSQANLDRLAADPQVAAVITAGCLECVVDRADQRAVPVISLDAAEEMPAPAEQRSWVFRVAPNAPDNADALSAAMAADRVDTFAVIRGDGPYPAAGLAWLREAAGRDGLQLVMDQQTSPDNPVSASAAAVASWTGQEPGFDPVAAPAATGPDAVVIWLAAARAPEVAAALRDTGYQGRLYLDMLAAGELFFAEPALQGASMVFTATAVADRQLAASPALAARQTWLRSYTGRYGTYHLHASFAADALLVAADAIGRAGPADGGPDRPAIRRALEVTRLDGLTGQIRFSSTQHSGLSAAALVLLTADNHRWR